MTGFVGVFTALCHRAEWSLAGCLLTIAYMRPQPKPLAQKPNRKATVFGGEILMHYIFYGTSRHTCSNPQSGGPGDCTLRVSRGHPPSIAKWVSEVHKPPHHGKVQPLRDARTASNCLFWDSYVDSDHVLVRCCFWLRLLEAHEMRTPLGY
ncbi:hypothetical protein T265_07682 [Opisthorchis viverrini]|uniref:Uncharacterized protein n=1 Tax=Opisthorchis viverrini TaxID=6198 RepID=A0A074ZBR6_OPIVI|nr:hypothetical protein T265_07682 [Opisthorchis viverrini]KER24731.1 hypothetical protein T265_07682 [Opisthorchis viverrini]